MNWELFIEAITWCVTFLALFLAWVPLALASDGNYTPKQCRAAYFVSVLGVLLLVLGIATIVGMRWFPQ